MIDPEITKTGFSFCDNEVSVDHLVDIDTVVGNAWYLYQHAIGVAAGADKPLLACDRFVLLKGFCSHGYSSPS